MKLNDMPRAADSIHAEQSVLGALLLDNDALDRIPDLEAAHFYRQDHQLIFAEICRQVSRGTRADVITIYEALHQQIPDCMPYLNAIAQNTPSAATIGRYAETVLDRALKRAMGALASEMAEQQHSAAPAEEVIDRMAARIEALAQKRTKQEPQRMVDMLGSYVDVINQRMDGTIRPIETGFADLDRRLDGGLERGTLTIVAGRPGTGKTAFGLCVGRNVAEWGSSLFLSMEMSRDQVNDRNIAALGKLPLAWLRRPSDKTAEGKENFTRMSHAFQRAGELNLFIDDQTSLNMMEIRAKARAVKRKSGLDMLVIDQLSFITGGDGDKSWEVIGQYTRALLALAKELNLAIVLLCQLSRKVEERNNKRPIMSDLALSGSIEQDAANIIFLYRDELYNPDSRDKGICEVITAKQRQGEPGVVGLAYIGAQTRFESLAAPWSPAAIAAPTRSKGFD
ncbi:replicative DNA helicase [Noviherbaspirillum suwonense]|jgi:replicative DNA helicase|uniref:DNA 5'-3' helicase n=1 Tax=Noviherbaspirillum suwonense TaxID=1224511 RepID=A0ABY1QK89_9BURK|nr:replicative DNA helicase [Noviherbaspirillum suwonense]SMP71846.1 replicative DNA helicase [Noviherbaspirillum suwonense]